MRQLVGIEYRRSAEKRTLCILAESAPNVLVCFQLQVWINNSYYAHIHTEEHEFKK